MTFEEDLDLQQLFSGEVAERAGRLIDGADALAGDGIDDETLGEMVREGHTLKGTARMMGFAVVSDAGKALEDAWRDIASGDIAATRPLKAALRRLPEEMMAAVGSDPVTGTAGLAEAMRSLRAALSDRTPPPDEEREQRAAGDLGGLLGAIDSWASGENVRVNAAGLFRLINEICSLRVDAEALVGSVSALPDGGPDEGLLERVRSQAGNSEGALLQLQERAVALASAPLSDITATFRQLVRYVARRSGKEVRFELVGDDLRVDRQVLERLADPLRHLLVNAIQHGIETPDERRILGKTPTATLSLRAAIEEHRLSVVVEDDGRGVDWAAVRRLAVAGGMLSEAEADEDDAVRGVLFSRNFSTSEPSDMVGDGQGLATVAAAAEALRGTVAFDSFEGEGTRVLITVPTSRALQDVLLVQAAGQTWGIPALTVLGVLPPTSVTDTDEVQWDARNIPVYSFAEAVGLRESDSPRRLIVVSTATGPVGFLVAAELGRRQVAARELGPILDGAPHLTGAALLGGGDVVVVVDPNRLFSSSRTAREADGPRRRVLVIDDSRGVRQVVGGALGSAGFEVDLAASPTEALSVLADQDFDAIVMDYVLPTMDGATLAGRVRELGITAPIVMLSGAATPDDQARALSAGANAYLDKDDVRKGALADAIEGLIAAA